MKRFTQSMLLPLALACTMAGVTQAETLDALLARMDQNATTSNSFSANVSQVDYTAIVKLKEESAGSLRLKKTKAGVIGVFDYQKPSPRTVHFTGGDLEEYLPKANILDVWKVGSKEKLLNQNLLLTFGLTGADVRKSYNAKVLGEETVSGIKTTHLELLPKDKEGAKQVEKIELWIPEGQTYAIQEKATLEGGANYKLWTYNDAKLNPNLPDSAYNFTPPAGATKSVHK